MVRRTQGPKIQHIYSQTRNRSHRRYVDYVSALYTFGSELQHTILFRGAWKTSTFKKYNFEAEGIPTNGGALHPLLKVREEIRNIFLEMGYDPLCPLLIHANTM